MKSRDRQRKALARKLMIEKMKSEILDHYDSCGVPDPTPYEAVKNILRKQYGLCES